jgi:outer membrane receptor protein involved in Fe transport
LLSNDDGKHVLLLVNGHAINDPLYGAARFDQGAGVPIDIIDHVEIIVGPGSVLYGSNAMLGVINVITKDAANYRGGHVSSDFEPGRSWRAGAGAGAKFELFDAPGEVTVGVDYYRRFGPSLDFAEQRFPPFILGNITSMPFRRGNASPNAWGGRLSDAYYAEAPAGTLRVRLGEVEFNVLASMYRRGVPYSTETVDVFFDDDQSFERDRALRLDLKHYATLSAQMQLTSRLYADAFGYQRRTAGTIASCPDVVNGGCTYHDVGQARWVGLEEQLSLDWLGDTALVTLLGFDVRVRRVESKQDRLDASAQIAVGPTEGRLDETDTLWSPYLQQTWSPASFIDFNAGARLDIERRYSPVVSPRGAIAVRPGDSTTIKAVYAEAFRAPMRSETDLATYRQAPSPDLRPETVRSVEASIQQRFETHRLMFGVFRSSWRDMVVRKPLSPDEQARLQVNGTLPLFVLPGVAQYENLATIENYGWNGSYDGSLWQSRFLYGLNVTSAYTRQSSGGVSEPLVVAPKLFGNVHAAYRAGGWVPTPALAVSYLGRRLHDRPLLPGAPLESAPPLAEFRFTLSGRVPGLTGLGYRASGTYASASHGPYIAGPNSGITLLNVVPQRLSEVPIDQYSVFFGLRYDFAGESSTAGEEP